MANYVTDDGVVLRVTDFSETSQVVGMFTRGHGLVPMIAKGSKRETKKNAMSGPLDLLTSGEVVFVPAKGAAELALLSKWELGNPRTKMRRDLAALNAAMVCAEVTSMLLVPHDPHAALYEEFEAAMELLSTPLPVPASQRMRAVVAYVKSALEEAGYGAVLDRCVVCGRAVAEDRTMRFSAIAGGVFCAECSDPSGRWMEAPARLVVALARLARPRELLATAGTERAADPESLLKAMEMLLMQVEAIRDRGLRTRYLLASVFAG